ncbi:MAG: DUF2516 family protein [Actinomycetota bacterium]|nr:DUF2516 family protein [Actinomycetota bacterium]
MNLFATVQGTLLLVLGVLALGCEVFAAVDALRHTPQEYAAAGKRTKGFWLAVLGVALAVGIITFFNPLGFVGIIAFVAAAVYLTDVRPALRQVSGRGGRTNQGPYGSW